MPIERVGSATSPSLTVPIEKLGYPGSFGEIHFLAQLSGDTRSDASRLHDVAERSFKVFGLLVKTPIAGDKISADFTENDGGSYLLRPATATEVRVSTPWGKFTIKANKLDELSLIELA